jgi:hypothetical protein
VEGEEGSAAPGPAPPLGSFARLMKNPLLRGVFFALLFEAIAIVLVVLVATRC